MCPEYLPLFSGFVGALVGAAGSVAVVWLQQRAQERQNRARLIVDTAVKACDSAERYAEFMAKNGKTVVTPELAYYVVLHTKLVEALSSGKAVSKEQWLAAHREADELDKAVHDLFSKDK